MSPERIFGIVIIVLSIGWVLRGILKPHKGDNWSGVINIKIVGAGLLSLVVGILFFLEKVRFSDF